ncbi:MAG TPA: CHC2 zinc finger domain-containing protein [Ktedonobacteraceae bacterium]
MSNRSDRSVQARVKGFMQTGNADLVVAYASLFVHCWSQYAVQQRDGSYWRVREPLTKPLLSAHLAGRCTLGTYLLDEHHHCAFAVFDADSHDGLGQLVGLAMELAQQEIPTVLEASRRGGHLWVHLAEPTPAQMVRAWLLPSAQALGVELYPKQESLGPDGACALMRLPLGIHRLARGWFPFVQVHTDGNVVPVGETVGECCAWACHNVQRVAVPEGVGVVCAASEPGGLRDIPLMASHFPLQKHHHRLMASHETRSRPGQGAIRAWCGAQDIVEVIGRFVALDRRGVGSCPFKEHHHRGDVRPSFQVFGGDDPHWYCYTWGRAGDLFDFVCLYYQISPQEAWARLQDGTLV